MAGHPIRGDVIAARGAFGKEPVSVMPRRSGETVDKREATPELLPYTASISLVVCQTVDGAAQAGKKVTRWI